MRSLILNFNKRPDAFCAHRHCIRLTFWLQFINLRFNLKYLTFEKNVLDIYYLVVINDLMCCLTETIWHG